MGLSIGVGVGVGGGTPSVPTPENNLLLETGDELLLEDGNSIELE